MKRIDVFTDGRFRVSESSNCKYMLEHKCESVYEDAKYKWAAHMYSVDNRGVPCSWCGRAASEGLQATFWFLKEKELNDT
jgi:hypothetical protein